MVDFDRLVRETKEEIRILLKNSDCEKTELNSRIICEE